MPFVWMVVAHAQPAAGVSQQPPKARLTLRTSSWLYKHSINMPVSRRTGVSRSPPQAQPSRPAHTQAAPAQHAPPPAAPHASAPPAMMPPTSSGPGIMGQVIISPCRACYRPPFAHACAAISSHSRIFVSSSGTHSISSDCCKRSLCSYRFRCCTRSQVIFLCNHAVMFEFHAP